MVPACIGEPPGRVVRFVADKTIQAALYHIGIGEIDIRDEWRQRAPLKSRLVSGQSEEALVPPLDNSLHGLPEARGQLVIAAIGIIGRPGVLSPLFD